MKIEVHIVRLFLLVATVVVFFLSPLAAIANDDPIDVVRGVYSRVLKPMFLDKQGRQLCVLRNKPEYRKEDFTSEFYQFILDVKRSFSDFRAGKRKNFFDQEVLTSYQSNDLAEWPTYRLKTKTADRAIVTIVSAGRGFYHINGQWDKNFRFPYSWDVEVRRETGRWQFANVWFSPKKDLLTEGKEFLSDTR